mgnify:CR=1 FL=1
MSANGTELITQSFNLPAQRIKFDGLLGTSFSDHGNFYCMVPNDGLRVYDEKTLTKKFTYKEAMEVVCSLTSSIIFLGLDHILYCYSANENEISIVEKEVAASCGHTNQNQQGDFLIMSGGVIGDESRLPKRKIHKYQKEPFELLWKVDPPSRRVNKFVIDEDKGVFYSITSETSMFCLTLNSAETVWKVNFAALIGDRSRILEVQPVLIGNAIVVIYWGLVLAFSVDNGDLLWKKEEGTTPWGVVSSVGTIYLLKTSQNKRHIVTIDGHTGNLVSVSAINADGHSGFTEDLTFTNPVDCVMSKTHMIIGWGNDFITAINPENGHVDWYCNVGSEHGHGIATISLCNNRLFCRTSISAIDNEIPDVSWVFEGAGGFNAEPKSKVV